MSPTAPAHAHADPETLLLYGLAGPLAPRLEAETARHVARCMRCADRLDAILAARFAEDESGAAAEPLRAAAQGARKWEAPPPPERLGAAGGVPIFRHPDDPKLFAVDRLEWAGKRVRIAIGGSATVEGSVDRFRRLRLPQASADALRLALESGAEVSVEPIE